MKATELIHQLQLLIAEAGADPEVTINGDDGAALLPQLDADTGDIVIYTLEECAICGGPTTLEDAYEAGIGDAICGGCR